MTFKKQKITANKKSPIGIKHIIPILTELRIQCTGKDIYEFSFAGVVENVLVFKGCDEANFPLVIEESLNCLKFARKLVAFLIDFFPTFCR